MPTVPKLESNVTQNVTNLGRVNTQVDLGDQQIGQAFGKAVDILQNEKDRADRLEVMRVDRELTQLEINMLHDKNNGALFKKGKDAFALPEEIDKTYQEESAKIKESLGGMKQKMIFDKIAADRKLSIDQTIQRHVGTQIREYDAQETDSYIKTQRDYALDNAYDSTKVDKAIGSQVMAITAHAQNNGLGPEFIKQKTQDIESKTHAAVIGKMINTGDDITAEQYYGKVKDRLSGDEKAAVEKDLEIASLRGKSQRTADEIWSGSKSYGQALDKVKDIEDPKLRDATQERINQLNHQKKIQEAERDKQYNIMSTNIIDKTGSTASIPPAIWQTFSNTERASLESYANMRRGGKERQDNDPRIYDDLQNLKAIAPDKFLEIDFTNPKYLTGLKSSTREQFSKTQAEMRAGKGKDGSVSDMQIMNDSLKLMGIKKDSDDGIAFRRMVDEQIEEFSKANGKKPSNKELRQITDALSVEVITDKGVLWDTKKRLFQLKDADLQKEFEVEIPERKKKDIEKFLNKKGIPVNDKNVREYYKKVLEAQGFISGSK